jgi:dienelactone hydrolase
VQKNIRTTRRELLFGSAAALTIASGLTSATVAALAGQLSAITPLTVAIQSGPLRLVGMVLQPPGSGPFPTVLFSHGGITTEESGIYDANAVGPVFAKHGYLFLYLFRRGHGQSQGEFLPDVLAREAVVNGEAARRRLQLRLLTTDHLDDVLAGLSYLKSHAAVDHERVAVVGHSFGGQATLLAAERDKSIRAVVTFAAAALSWENSPELRDRLLGCVRNIAAPIFLTHAANDYSTEPGRQMAAELARLNRTHELKIYPAVGKTAGDGHTAVFTDAAHWEPDVFAFLDRHMRDDR